MTEQRFTDEDLKRLKEAKANHGNSEMLQLSYGHLGGILARLEVSELCNESLDDLLHHGIKYPNGTVHESDPELAKERLEAWRRVAGK